MAERQASTTVEDWKDVPADDWKDVAKTSATPVTTPQPSVMERAKQNLIPSAINSVKRTLMGPSMGEGGIVQPQTREQIAATEADKNKNGLGQRFPGRMGNLLHSAPLIEHPYETVKNAFAEDPIGTLQAPSRQHRVRRGLFLTSALRRAN